MIDDHTPALQAHQLAVPAALRDDIAALVGVEMGLTGPTPLAIAPHDALVLSLQLGRGAEPIGPKGGLGLNTHLTGIRRWTGAFTGAGDCVTLFALLTPLGAVRLLDCRRLDASPRIRAPLAQLLDAALTRQLEARIVRSVGVADKLQAFGAWLEARAEGARRLDRSALRAARAAMRLRAEPRAALQAVADEQHVSRRQLERDFERWLGVSPRHLSQVARLQGVAREVHRGATLADAAAGLGFADQSHMNRVVRQLTGLTPRQFVSSASTPLAAAFRAATGGGTVYL